MLKAGELCIDFHAGDLFCNSNASTVTKMWMTENRLKWFKTLNDLIEIVQFSH